MVDDLLSAADLDDAATAAAIVGAMSASARDLVGIFGVRGTVRLMQQAGGARHFMPIKLRDDSHLIGLFGRDASEKLSYYLGGAHFEFPSVAGVVKVLRDRAIRADHAAGVPRNTIATRHGITVRHLHFLLNGPGAKDAERSSAKSPGYREATDRPPLIRPLNLEMCPTCARLREPARDASRKSAACSGRPLSEPVQGLPLRMP